MAKTLYSPFAVIAAASLGALIGWELWPILVSVVISTLGATYQGFPSILFDFLGRVGAAIGAATAFALIISFGKYRRTGGLALAIASILATIWITPYALDFARLEGRRLALAVYGLPMLWACALIYFGHAMRRKTGQLELKPMICER